MKAKNGFTLVEMLVIIATVTIIAFVAALILNPMKIIRRSRDVARISDLANLQLAINTLIQENPGPSAHILCASPASPPCSGASSDPSPDTKKPDMTGWVKVKFDSRGAITASILPVDPINSGNYIYVYATNAAGDKWEINATLESEREIWRMSQDGGNNPNKYEVGLNLAILP